MRRHHNLYGRGSAGNLKGPIAPVEADRHLAFLEEAAHHAEVELLRRRAAIDEERQREDRLSEGGRESGVGELECRVRRNGLLDAVEADIRGG